MCENLVVVTPVFNDWESFRILAEKLSDLAAERNFKIQILAIDDGSNTPSPLAPLIANHLESVEVIRLVCNLGHQRAIAIGLVEARKIASTTGVIVMDCDGEDRVEDIYGLVTEARSHPSSLIVATRSSRSEGVGFRTFYAIYKYVFWMLVGTRIDFGNFTFIPRQALGSLVHSAGIWNHLAASICRSRLPFIRRPCPRGSRYAGQSKMNFSSLLIHGLGAMSVYVDVILVRLITLISAFVFILAIGIASIMVIRLATELAIPGWATNAIGLLLVLLVQSFIFVFTSVFMVLNLRTIKGVIPAIDGSHFIESRFNLPLEATSNE